MARSSPASLPKRTSVCSSTRSTATRPSTRGATGWSRRGISSHRSWPAGRRRPHRNSRTTTRAPGDRRTPRTSSARPARTGGRPDTPIDGNVPETEEFSGAFRKSNRIVPSGERGVMRKRIAGLIVGGLLAVAAPASAQFGDPLSLAAAGVLIPFFGNGANGDLSFVELAAPVGGVSIHMIFYNAACTRVISLAETLTANEVAIVPIAPVAPGVNGLVAVAWTANGNDLIPLPTAIHSRVYWVNVVSGRARVLEPITLETYQVSGATTWNPLRSGATFVAPQETANIHTVVYLICPKD